MKLSRGWSEVLETPGLSTEWSPAEKSLQHLWYAGEIAANWACLAIPALRDVRLSVCCDGQCADGALRDAVHDQEAAICMLARVSKLIATEAPPSVEHAHVVVKDGFEAFLPLQVRS